MKKIIFKLLIYTFILTSISAKAQTDFVVLMQQGKIFYDQKNYVSALERFSQACNFAKSDSEKKDSETWRSNCFKNLQKQHAEMEKTIRSNDIELKRMNSIVGTIYFYENRIGLAFKDQKYGYIDKNGNIVIPFTFDKADYFDPNSGFAKVSRNNVQYLIDTAGNEYPLANNINAINGTTVALDLRNQQLSSIPVLVYNCYNLKVLLLGSNILSSVPDEISKLRNLIYLDLSNNKIQNLSEQFGQLIYLKQLTLSGNQLGKLPDGFSQLQNLEELNIDNNNLFILPTGFGNLHNLKYLSLNSNKLKSIPDDFCRLYALKTFRAQKNDISKIAPEIGNLGNIETIILDENNITDLPQSMERLKNLKELHVSRNKIINVPVELKKLNNLKAFDLRGNRIPQDKKAMIKAWFPDCNVEI